MRGRGRDDIHLHKLFLRVGAIPKSIVIKFFSIFVLNGESSETTTECMSIFMGYALCIKALKTRIENGLVWSELGSGYGQGATCPFLELQPSPSP